MGHDPNNIATWPLHEQAQTLWQREGGHCASSLVATLALGYADLPRSDLANLADQAFELSCPIDDWERAAREVGWATRPDGGWQWSLANLKPGTLHEPDWDTADTAQLACEASDVEPYQREVFEHWIVSDWLANQLAAKGEKVDKDFAGLTIWARTTTGQAVYADHVIEQIAAETYGREG